VQGTKVVKDGVEWIASTQPATIVMGKESLSVSGQYDTQVTVHAPAVTRVRDGEDGLDLPRGGSAAANIAARGAHWDTAGDKLMLQVTQGQRAFKLNDKPMPQEVAPVTLDVEIDGVPSQVILPAHSDVDGKTVASGRLNNPAGFYEVVEAPPGFIFAKYGTIKSGLLEANISVVLRSGEGGVLKLKKVTASSEAIQWQDPEQKRATMELNEIEAEGFTAWGGKQPSRYTTRPFLSGGKGMGNWDLAGQWAKWTLDVPKAGKYDLVLKYATFWAVEPPAGTPITRYAQLGSKMHFFGAPKTESFGSVPEHWRGLRVRLDQQLPAGPVDLTMWADNGGMNLDWIGLVEVKEDEEIPTAPGNLRLSEPAGESVSVAWDASTDNVEVKEYAIYVNGIMNAVVPATQLSAVLTDLSPGTSYSLSVRAVDTSDNRSIPSNTIEVATGDTTAPVWSQSASFHPVGFPNVIRLNWDPATDNSGKVASYSLYQVTEDGRTPIATVTGTVYDLLGLQPDTAYTYQVEARDAAGNESLTGPSVTVTLPASNDGFYDTFDDWADGDVAVGQGWEYSREQGSTVRAVPLPDLGGKGLQATDPHYDPANEYVYTPVMARTTAPLSGKVTVETRTKFSKLSGQTTSGNPEIEIFGDGKPFIRFTGFSDGTIGYQRTVNGTAIRHQIPGSGFPYPVDEWITLRFDIDLETQTYAITMQADSLKSYAGRVEGSATLDKERGIYRVEGVTFYNTTTAITSVNRFNYRHGRYTGIQTFDYVTMYNSNVPDLSVPADAVLSASASEPTNSDVVVTIDYPANAVTREYRLSADGPWAPYEAPIVVTDNTTVYARGTSAAGVTSNVASYVVSNIDKTAPVSTASVNPALPNGSNGWYTSDVTVNIEAGDPSSGVAAIEYQVNDGEWLAYTGAVTASEEGSYTIGYRSTDHAGNVEPVQTIEFRIDRTAPELSIALDRTELWPANHKMVTVNASLQASDAGSGMASVVLTSITSSEPEGDLSDIRALIGTDTQSFDLRAERDGNGIGRVYTITYTATDMAGHSTVVTAEVTVPHNQYLDIEE
jgi:chitodextrinase